MDVEWSLLQDEGLPELLSDLLNPQPLAADWVCLLIAADVSEASDYTVSDLTEPTNDGYSRKIVHRPDWEIGVASGGCVHALMTAHPLVWEATSGSTPIYGFAYYNPQTDKLISVSRFTDAARPTWAAGSTLTLYPDFPLTSATC